MESTRIYGGLWMNRPIGCHYPNHPRNNVDWISVKNKLPSATRDLTLTWDGSQVEMEYYDPPTESEKRLLTDDEKNRPWRCAGCMRSRDVTHWMPLPEVWSEQSCNGRLPDSVDASALISIYCSYNRYFMHRIPEPPK